MNSGGMPDIFLDPNRRRGHGGRGKLLGPNQVAGRRRALNQTLAVFVLSKFTRGGGIGSPPLVLFMGTRGDTRYVQMAI